MQLISKEKYMKGNIMVIDDNRSILKIVGHWLEKAGYGVSTCRRPLEGLRLLGEGSFDLLILDLRMRELSGTEVLTRVKADGKLSNLPVIVITGQSVVRNVGLEERELFDAIVEKPFERDEFLRRVEETLAQVRSAG